MTAAANHAGRPSPSALSALLAERAEEVCRAYLPSGSRTGHYWTTGNIHDEAGDSLRVTLSGRRERIGKWRDYATGEHGDLLDLVRIRGDHPSLGPAMAEAGRFLGLGRGARRPRPPPRPADAAAAGPTADAGATDDDPAASARKARALWNRCGPISGSLAERYLTGRGILDADHPCLRFDPALAYRDGNFRTAGPAMVAALTDPDGAVHAVQRTWIHGSGRRKADLPSSRKLLGRPGGCAVRFHPEGAAHGVIVAEGIETVLSVLAALPAHAAVAAVSASLMPALLLPHGARRVLIAADRDPAGYRAAIALQERLRSEAVASVIVLPVRADFNDDLRAFGPVRLRAHLEARIPAGLPGARPRRAPREPAGPEPVIHLSRTRPGPGTEAFGLVALDEIDRASLVRTSAFEAPPTGRAIDGCAAAWADIARIACARAGTDKVLLLCDTFLAGPLESALRERGLRPLHAFFRRPQEAAPEGSRPTARFEGFVEAPAERPAPARAASSDSCEPPFRVLHREG